MEDEPHGAPDAGPAVSRFRAPADDGAKAATRSGLRDDSVAGVAARVQRRLPDTRDSRVRDRAVVSVPAAHPRPPGFGDRVTLTGAGFMDINSAPASPGLRLRRAAPAGEAITKE